MQRAKDDPRDLARLRAMPTQTGRTPGQTGVSMRDSNAMAAPTLPAGTRVGEYIVGERLGVGGFSEVFRVTQPTLRKDAAMKVLDRKYCDDQAALTRFVDEARTMSQLEHPGIASVFGFGDLDDGRQYYVMELLPGKTLATVLGERIRLPLAEALPILRGIAVAVDAAHAANIAHRDIKPDNVFVLPDGTTKLIDFGIAKLVRDASRVATETGSVLGTPQYMSPEQCRGRGSDIRSDAYSFGALAYHVLVGEPPFTGEPLEIALHHLNDRPVAPSKRVDLPAQADRVVLALLEKDPALRPLPLVSAVAALDGVPLRRRWSTRTKVAALAAPLVIGGVAFAIASRDPAPVVDSEIVAPVGGCQDSSRRLSSVWDDKVRAELANRFAGGSAGDREWWLDATKALDDFATGWGVAWDGACHHDDEVRDPLRHAQRLACLENAFLDLRAGVDALSTIEVKTLVDIFDPRGLDGLRGRKLVDCQNPRVLRAQVAAPPIEHRDRIAALWRDANRVLMEAWIAFSHRDTKAFDRAVDRHAAIARDVEAIDAPSAAVLISDRAWLLSAHADDVDQQRRPAARKELLDGLRRIENSGDNVAIATAYTALGGLESAVGDGDAVAKIGELMPKIEAAVRRAGDPVLPALHLAQLRGEHAMRQGRFVDAIPLLRTAVALAREHGALWDYINISRLVFHALIESGDSRTALAESGDWVTYETRRHSATHPLATGALLAHAIVLDPVGELEKSLVTREKVAKVMHNLGAHAPIWTRAYILHLEHRLGRRPADTAEILGKLVGTTPPRHNPDGPATVRRAGMFELYAYSVEQGMTDEDRRADHAAILAFQRGDRATMAREASIVVARCKAKPCADWIRFSRWLALLTDPTPDAQLAALEREYPDKSALAYSGIVLAQLGRWDDAKNKLEAARGVPNIWESQSDLTELDGWLGLARVRAGDLAGARTLFEEALATMSIWGNGFDGFSYMTPVVQLALAEILWRAPDGDRARARRLATRAVAGFVRLGPQRAVDKASAENWLADHPS